MIAHAYSEDQLGEQPANWRKRSSARAQIRLAIEDTLDDGLPRAYTKELCNAKCEVLFEHVYESYQGDGRSVYAQAG